MTEELKHTGSLATAEINIVNTETTAMFSDLDYKKLVELLMSFKIPGFVLIFPPGNKFAVLKFQNYSAYIDIPVAEDAYKAISSKVEELRPVLEYYHDDHYREVPTGFYNGCTTLDNEVDLVIRYKKQEGISSGQLDVIGSFKKRPGIPGFRAAVCPECGHKQFWECRDVGSPSHSNCDECRTRFDEEKLFIGNFVPKLIQDKCKGNSHEI